MTIKDIPLFKVFMSADVKEPLSQIVMSGYVGQGPQVDRFEELLRSYFGNPYINTVNSATSGLHLAVRLACGDGPTGEVLTTPLTCTATNFPILANGQNIRWVDVDPNTCNIDIDDLARKISPQTKAIMLVHWGGYPCDLDAVKNIQAKSLDMFGFAPPVIEDCAHAFGSKYKGKLLGNHGNICVYSFQAIKHFTTVDGGAIISPDFETQKQAKLLRWYGLDRTTSADFRCEQNIPNWGYKFHMNDINATIGIHNLPHIPTILERHKQNAAFYRKHLADVPGVELLENKGNRESTSWIYTMKVQDRDGFARKMKEQGIMVSRVHDRNDKHTCLKQFQCCLPQLDQLCQTMICIPCGWWVTDEDRQHVVNSIQEGW